MIVSVIMPSYKSSKTLKRAVESVINQTYPHWELLIINDACPEKSYKVVEQYVSDKIKILHNKENSKTAATRNHGIKEAIGKYIAFLDSDDYWLPNKLEKQIALLQSGADVVYSDYLRDSNGKLNRVKTPKKVDYETMLTTNYIGNLTGVYNAEKLGKVYQEEIRYEDYIMWLDLVKKANHAYSVNEPLAVYTVDGDSYSSNKLKAATWFWNIHRNVLKHNLIKSSYYFTHYAINSILKRIPKSSK